MLGKNFICSNHLVADKQTFWFFSSAFVKNVIYLSVDSFIFNFVEREIDSTQIAICTLPRPSTNLLLLFSLTYLPAPPHPVSFSVPSPSCKHQPNSIACNEISLCASSICSCALHFTFGVLHRSTPAAWAGWLKLLCCWWWCVRGGRLVITTFHDEELLHLFPSSFRSAECGTRSCGLIATWLNCVSLWRRRWQVGPGDF